MARRAVQAGLAILALWATAFVGALLSADWQQPNRVQSIRLCGTLATG